MFWNKTSHSHDQGSHLLQGFHNTYYAKGEKWVPRFPEKLENKTWRNENWSLYYTCQTQKQSAIENYSDH